MIANGDTRTISFHHLHTGEDLTITYKRDGRYDEAALEKINWELRDWRREQPAKMDPHLIDLVWEVQRELGSTQPIQIVCGYRSPQTNAMLRASSRGVAEFSQHMLGKAMDFYLADVSLEKIREVGLRLQRGGVGFYPTSGSPFVHLDTGNVRHWPKVSREYLAKIFPDGKTVHIPADGRPMPGFQQALAEIKARGEEVPTLAYAAAGDSGLAGDGGRVKNFFAALLGKKKDEPSDDGESQITTVQSRPAMVASDPTTATTVATKPITAAVLDKPAQAPKMQWVAGPGVKTAETSPPPVPRSRPADTGIAVASLGNDAPLPAVITGGADTRTSALGYAPNESVIARSSPIAVPQQFAPSQTAAAPVPRKRVVEAVNVADPVPAQPMTANVYADAANAPASLFRKDMIQFTGELRQPDFSTAMRLSTPVRVAVRVQFADTPGEQPALSRFAGPAVVNVPTVFFGREAALASATNAN